MRSQNIKCNSFGKVGGGSCLFLLLLGFLAINPMISLSAFAIDSAPDGDSDTGSSTTQSTPSTVNIEFSPASGSASMTPITAEGVASRFSVTATIRVQNSGGYNVYLGSSSNKLTRVGGTETIEPIAGSVAYENLETNTWGYAYAEGETIADTVKYSAVPNNLRSEDSWVGGNSSTNIKDETKTYTMSFAAKIGSNKPTGTYENQVTMSVVSSPLEVANDFGILSMQEMTTAICSNASDVDGDGVISAQLEDIRDGKYYWVTKLADNNCWMTQNLDLDLATSKELTSATSDVANNWKPSYSTAITATSSTILADNTGQRSWSLGNYRLASPLASSNCGSEKNSAADCPAQFTTYATPTSANGDINAHYILGNHYQWNAATAGSGGTITSGQATSSICPKGWKLPTSASSGEFQALINAGPIGTDVAKLMSAPYYFITGGVIYQNTELLSGAGGYGFYWSSTPDKTQDSAFSLGFYGDEVIDPKGSSPRLVGLTVRCIATEERNNSITYSVTYAHNKSAGTLPDKQEAQSSADTYTFTVADKGSIYDSSCGHPFVGWSTTMQSSYSDTAEYVAGSSITLTKDNPAITLYPVWGTGMYCI